MKIDVLVRLSGEMYNRNDRKWQSRGMSLQLARRFTVDEYVTRSNYTNVASKYHVSCTNGNASYDCLHFVGEHELAIIQNIVLHG